jgi:hypothetical protein
VELKKMVEKDESDKEIRLKIYKPFVFHTYLTLLTQCTFLCSTTIAHKSSDVDRVTIKISFSNLSASKLNVHD